MHECRRGDESFPPTLVATPTSRKKAAFLRQFLRRGIYPQAGLVATPTPIPALVATPTYPRRHADISSSPRRRILVATPTHPRPDADKISHKTMNYLREFRAITL